MAILIDKTIISKYVPQDKNTIWIDTAESKPTMRIYLNGTWSEIAESSSSGQNQINFLGNIEPKDLPEPTYSNMGALAFDVMHRQFIYNNGADWILFSGEKPSGYTLYSPSFDSSDSPEVMLDYEIQQGQIPEIIYVYYTDDYGSEYTIAVLAKNDEGKFTGTLLQDIDLKNDFSFQCIIDEYPVGPYSCYPVLKDWKNQ